MVQKLLKLVIRKKRYRGLIVVLATIIIIFASTNSTAERIIFKSTDEYIVTSVADGDTFTAENLGQEITVRLLGVDTPETHKPNTPVQCYGPEASDFTKKLLIGRKVKLQTDLIGKNKDRYDRYLRYVYLEDGRELNSILISNGYGFAITGFDYTKKTEFNVIQDSAKASGIGLWGNCQINESKGYNQTNNL